MKQAASTCDTGVLTADQETPPSLVVSRPSIPHPSLGHSSTFPRPTVSSLDQCSPARPSTSASPWGRPPHACTPPPGTVAQSSLARPLTRCSSRGGLGRSAGVPECSMSGIADRGSPGLPPYRQRVVVSFIPVADRESPAGWERTGGPLARAWIERPVSDLSACSTGAPRRVPAVTPLQNQGPRSPGSRRLASVRCDGHGAGMKRQ